VYSITLQVEKQNDPIIRALSARVIAVLLRQDNLYKSFGYYGETIYHLDDYKVKCDIEKYNSAKTVTEKLHVALELEYSYVLPSLARHEKWELKEVPTAEIHFAEHVAMKTYPKTRKEYVNIYKEIENDNPYGISGAKNFFPAILVDGFGPYSLVDGYHRLAAAFELKKNTIKIIAPSG